VSDIGAPFVDCRLYRVESCRNSTKVCARLLEASPTHAPTRMASGKVLLIALGDLEISSLCSRSKPEATR
jgi:hypothetical protein